MIRILLSGTWSASDVSQAWLPCERKIVPEVELAIESAWGTALARPGVHLFDGPMCRLESWNATENRLRLTLSKTSYKTFLGTNMVHPEFADTFGPEVMANPVGLSPSLLTSDGQLLFGQRTQTVAYYPGRVHPFAGSLEPGDEDLFAAVARELKEELSLEAGDLSKMCCTGIVEDESLRQPEVIFAVESPRTKSEIESRLDPVEHQAVVGIANDAESVERAICDEQRLTPVAIGTLLLWGRLRFGQEWFDRNASFCGGGQG